MKVKPSLLLAALLGCALVLGTTAAGLRADDAAKAGKKSEKKEGDKKADKPVNAKCPVSQEDVDPSVTHAHKGKTIAFCCEGCLKDFKKEPAKYLKNLEEQEKVTAEGGEGETGEAGEAETEEPAEGGAAEGKEGGEAAKGGKKEEAELNAKCPVSDDDADPAHVYKYKGREVAFCCEGCMDDFKKTPEKFAGKLEKKGGKKPAKGAGDKGKKEGA